MAGRFSVEAVFKGIDQLSAPVRRMSKTMGRFTRSAERGLRKLNKGLNAVGKTMKRGLAVGAAAATVAVGALTIALRGVADEADALAKQSRRLDFPIEQLQEWRFVAEQSGLGAEEFGKGVEKLAKGIGEARAGTGTLITLLKKTNPELLKQLVNTDNVADATELYIKAIEEAPDAMSRAALATAAFGRQGTKFINIAEQGSDAIAKLRAEQQENGVITRQQAEAAEAFNDAINSAKKAVIGFAQQALLPMMPLLTDLIRQFREWTVANRELVSGKILDFFKFVVNNFDDIIARLALFAKAITVFIAFSAIIKTVTALLTLFNLVAAANPISLIVLGVIALTSALVALVVWIDDVVAAFDEMPKALQFVLAPFGVLIKAIKFVKDNFGTIQKVAAGVGKALGKFTGFGEGAKEAEPPKPIKFNSDSAIANGPDISKIVDIATARRRREDDHLSVASLSPSVVTPEERLATQINEQRSTAELTIKDESGRAEISGETAPGINIQLDKTGTL